MTPGWRRRLGLLIAAAACGVVQADERRSGFDFMSPPLQAMQRDDTQNPAMLAVQDGAALWSQRPDGAKSCADCHRDASRGMRGVAARYPRFDAGSGRPVNLSMRIEQCRVRQQNATPLPPEHADRLALEALIALASRGMPIAPDPDPRLAPFRTRGEALFKRRLGQLDLACTQCHDQHAGGRLGGSVIPQGHPTGYPVYRLEWQGLGSLQRRLRNCLSGVRAEPFGFDSTALVELELYLAQRAAGMAIDAPAVRP